MVDTLLGELSQGRRPGPCKWSILLNEIVEVSERLRDPASSRIWPRDPGPHCRDGLVKAPVSPRPLACRRHRAPASLLSICSLPFCPDPRSGTSLLASNPLRNSRSKTHRNGEGGAAQRPPCFSFLAAKDLPMPQKTPPDNRVKTCHQGFVLRILLARADQGSPP
jgi:hypothetical protein